MYLSGYHRGENLEQIREYIGGLPPSFDVKISMSNLIMSTYTNWSDDTFGNRMLNESSNRSLVTRRIPDSITNGYRVSSPGRFLLDMDGRRMRNRDIFLDGVV